MTAKKSSTGKIGNFTPELMDPLKLKLDSENPRLVDVVEGAKRKDQDVLLRAVWDFGVLEIVTSIAASGFHHVEPLFAEKQPDGSFVVIEGNRRLCALQVLLDPERATRLGISGLPTLSAEIRKSCVAVPVAVGDRKAVWAFIGTKHLNGPKTWDSAAKAAYIKHVHEKYGIPLDDIADAIGDRNRTVRRMYESMKIFDQAQEWSAYRRSDSGRKRGDTPFSHLYTIVGYDSVRKYLGMADPDGETPESKLSAPVPKASKAKLAELLRWVYGHKGEDIAPVIVSQNPDLRNLAKALSDKRGVEALRAGSSPLSAAESAEGDEAFVEAHLAKGLEELEQVSKKFATGYTGQVHIANLLLKVRDVVRGLGVQRMIKDNPEELA